MISPGFHYETDHFRFEHAPRGLRITAKDRRATPRSRVVRPREWDRYLAGLSDSTKDAAAILDFGVGCFEKKHFTLKQNHHA